MKNITLTEKQYNGFCKMFDTLIRRTEERKTRYKVEKQNDLEMLKEFYKVFTESTEQ